jgi:phosphatidylinositol glycan class A protein
MVCDFFYPRLGGVEMHIWSLSQCLIRLGHKVIIITHSYGGRKGVRYMTNGLKVYYTPQVPFMDQNSLPTTISMFPLLRNILVREQIDIVHGHQATSTMMHEAIIQARTMGYKVCYTDHSLFGFADAASVHVNKLLTFTLSDIDHAICVSHTCRENLVLRASLNPEHVSTIPNAVDATKFIPDPTARKPKNTINIIIMSRLVYRKGIDLVVAVIPEILARFAHAHFIIGGDGPMRLMLEEMIERHQLHERVELLGAVPHAQVRDVLVRGHIFLNSSLTESFCIAILEAACCGLYTVSTKVGGVPEVLPPDMVSFAESTTPAGLVNALSSAMLVQQKVDPAKFHAQVKAMYDWHDVAARTQRVYTKITAAQRPALIERLQRYYSVGFFAGIIAAIHMAIMFLLWRALEWMSPAHEIELAVDFPFRTYKRHQRRFHEGEAVVPKLFAGTTAKREVGGGYGSVTIAA